MAYIGVKHRVNPNRLILVKLHGPSIEMILDEKELTATVGILVDRAFDEDGSDLKSACLDIARDIITVFGDGEEIVWSDCEIHNNNIVYSASAVSSNVHA